MNFKLQTALSRFRCIAFIEGISYIILVFIAMPFKYFADMPLLVKYFGWAHGFLFVLYCLLLLHVWIVNKWSFGKAVLAFIVSLIPFGTFWLDVKLRKEEEQLSEVN